ncbi:MAG: thioredoxin domain-containing protein [Archangium sp.]|nr:thioredoxin domain-containing protein [Archangium sp.]
MRGAFLAFLAFLALVASSSACVTVPVKDEGPSPVVARYGDRVIRQAEVDEKVIDELSKLQEQIYDLRSEAAERIAIEALVAQKAKAEGLSEDDWLGKNVENGLAEPSDAEMRALFDKAKGRLPDGVGFDDVKPQLKQALTREARAKKAREVFGKLKKDAGFTMVLEAPAKQRKTIDVATGPTRGGKGAKVVIVEFADFQCPYCARAHETVSTVMKAYGEKVRIIFRHYPLANHPKAPKAAEATACADEQGKFWELHDSLFESGELDEDALAMQAKRIGVDEKKYDECMKSGRMASLVKRDMAAGQAAGVSGTPAFFINGLQLSGAQPEEAFRKLIDAELARLGE